MPHIIAKSQSAVNATKTLLRSPGYTPKYQVGLLQPLQPHCARRQLSTIKPFYQQQPQSKDSGASPSDSPKSYRADAGNEPVQGTTTIAILGPSWLWTPLKPLQYPLNAYNRAQSKRPYLTQLISSLIIYFLGDLSSQLIQQPPPTVDPTKHTPSTSATVSQPQEQQADVEREVSSRIAHAWEHYDPARSLRALIIGSVFSIPSYKWFMYLSTMFPAYSHLPRLTLQVVINQITFAPFFNSYFFGMQALLSHHTTRAITNVADVAAEVQERVVAAGRHIAATVPTSWNNSCKFWPLVTAFSLTFVQPRSRSVFAGIVAIGWQTYLGLVNQRAIAQEKLLKESANA